MPWMRTPSDRLTRERGGYSSRSVVGVVRSDSGEYFNA
jgi:hypothetical protein